MQIDSCCDKLCTCDLPYNKATLGLLEKWKAKRCGAATCKVAGCADDKVERAAVCEAGQCKAVVK